MKNLSKLLILLLLAKMISVALWWYLPNDGVELNAKKSYQAKYQRVDFKNMLVSVKVVDSTNTQTSTSLASCSIDSLTLKGLYGTKFNGYAIVAKNSAPLETTIVAVGDVYAGYKLKEIRLNKVIFTKNGQEYVLSLNLKKDKLPNAIEKVKQNMKNGDAEYRVTREDIKYYANDPSKIWKDIAIGPVKKNGKITGFKVSRIKPNSQFARIGLQKGDIIIKANNVRLASFNDALNIYKNIKNISTVDLVVLRNNQEKEIIYEIH